MEHSHEAQAALTVAVALAAGIVCQALAHHARTPGIVLLLAAGVVLGPDVRNDVQPETLGPALQAHGWNRAEKSAEHDSTPAETALDA